MKAPLGLPDGQAGVWGSDHKPIWNNSTFFQHYYPIFDRV